MSKSRTFAPENEPEHTMDEAELLAYRQAGGPVDTYNNPIQYFGKRGALAGHIEQVDKYLQRIPKYKLIMAQDAVMEKSKIIYASDQAVLAAEAERELRAFDPARAINYTTIDPAPAPNRRSMRVDTVLKNLQSTTPSARHSSIPALTSSRAMSTNEWHRYGVNDHAVLRAGDAN